MGICFHLCMFVTMKEVQYSEQLECTMRNLAVITCNYRHFQFYYVQLSLKLGSSANNTDTQ